MIILDNKGTKVRYGIKGIIFKVYIECVKGIS